MRTALKSWSMILAALGIGALALYLSADYLDAKEKSLTERLRAQFETGSPILVAARDIQAGEFASSQNLAIASVDMEFMPVDVLTPDDFNSVQTLEIMHSIPAGKPVLKSYLGSEIAFTFSELIPAGFRPVTIRVEEISSNERMVEVGDRVDLLRKPVKDSREGLSVLAENIEVVATGALRSASRDAASGAVAGTDDRQRYSTITVLLKVAQASDVMLAQQGSGVVSLLRNRGDTSSLSAMLGSAGKTKKVVMYSKSSTQDGSLKALEFAPGQH